MGHIVDLATPGRRALILSLAESGLTLRERLLASNQPILVFSADRTHLLIQLHLCYLLKVGEPWQQMRGIHHHLLEMVPCSDLINDISDEIHDLLLQDLQPYDLLHAGDDDEIVKHVDVTPGFDGLFHLEDNEYLRYLEMEIERVRGSGYNPDLQFNQY